MVLYNVLVPFVAQPRRAVHSTARNAVLVPIYQGTEITIVTKYVPLRDYEDAVWESVQSRRAMMWNDLNPLLLLCPVTSEYKTLAICHVIFIWASNILWLHVNFIR